MKKIVIMSVAALALAACSHSTKKVGETAPLETKAEKVAEKRGEHVVSKISFDKGNANLNSGARSELNKAVSQARQMGEIDEVTVAVWSDMEYPARKAAKLPKKQVDLAGSRGDKIEDFLAKDLDVSSYRVRVHNMGQKPNFLSEYFDTADAELKNELTAMGIAPHDGKGNIVTGQAGKALVFIKLKE
ncbi:MAG: hypothetical protein KF865_09020 [Bdellovibrionaceae bacterium]|nr:hypothetical protein [Pseudobdellovibrionaceae bacterium]